MLDKVLSKLQLPARCRPKVHRVDWQIRADQLAGCLADMPRLVFLDCNSLEQSNWGQISVVGWSPLLEFVVDSSGNTVLQPRGAEPIPAGPVNPLELLAGVLDGVVVEQSDGQLPFVGGWMGYISYEFGRFIEDLPATAVDDIRLPMMWMALFDNLAVFDHGRGQWYFVQLEFEDGLLGRLQQDRQVGRVQIESRLRDKPASGKADCELIMPVTFNISGQGYREIVARAVEYIHAGDIFQVNLSQRLTVGYSGDSWQLYNRLRQSNPGGFNAYIKLAGGAILSTSPELFLDIRDDYVLTRPIKGTRPRGADRQEDQTLARQLQESDKDRAELNMIIDLERNDLGRVCRFGTVKVINDCVLETHPSVFHLVGEIEGYLRTGIKAGGFVDLLRACYPGGSITGAPKIRAMQIIDQLEPTVRSVYTGSIGYISLNGTSVWNIAIRTALCSGHKLHLQLGAGIVADSNPDAEYRETLDKGKSMLAGLGLDQQLGC